MPDPAPNAELLRSLGRLVRGLSALFWGLPVALIVCVHTAKADWFKSFGIVPPLVDHGLVGLTACGNGRFPEAGTRLAHGPRPRQAARPGQFRALAPSFTGGTKSRPTRFFLVMVVLLIMSALLFLASLNLVLRRLGAMLPDETLRLEIRQFTALNLNLLFVTFLLALLYLALGQFPTLPFWLGMAVSLMERGGLWFLILLILLPLAMTMALLWKTKEVILDNVFAAHR